MRYFVSCFRAHYVLKETIIERERCYKEKIVKVINNSCKDMYEKGKEFQRRLSESKLGTRPPKNKVVRFLYDNELIMLSSIYDSIIGKKPKKCVFYEVLLKVVTESNMFDFTPTGYCKDYGIKITSADKFINALFSIGYKVDYKSLLHFDVHDYELHLENELEKLDLKEIRRQEYMADKYVEPRFLKKELTKDIEPIKDHLAEFRQANIDRKDPYELKMKDILDSMGVAYEYQKILYVGGNFYIADFFLPEHNIIIEVDGGIHYNQEQLIKDRLRDSAFAKRGVLTIRFDTEDRTFNFDVNVCLRKVLLNEDVL